VVGGFAWLWKYEMSPGAVRAAPAHLDAALPTGNVIAAPYTLFLTLHPHCPCSKATVRELNRIVTRCDSKLKVVVLIIRPLDVPAGWERTGLWDEAASIPGVIVEADVAALRSRSLGAETSGQAILYSPGGQLLFQGGITSSRGHEGDNAGSDAIVAAVVNHLDCPAAPPTTAVYGCPLTSEPCTAKGRIP
jgi:hypothetical protein